MADIPLGYMQSQRFKASDLLVNGSGWLRAESDSPITGMEFFGTVDGKAMAAVATGALSATSGVFPLIHSGEEGALSCTG